MSAHDDLLLAALREGGHDDVAQALASKLGGKDGQAVGVAGEQDGGDEPRRPRSIQEGIMMALEAKYGAGASK